MAAGVGRVLLSQSADFERLPPLSSARGKQSAGLFASRSRLLKVQVPSIKKRTTKRLFSFFLVAGVGLEPHGLRVMSPTSYQLLYPAIYGAGNRA